SCWRSWRCGGRNDSAALGQPRGRVEREREGADLLVAIREGDLELHLVPLDAAAETHRPVRWRSGSGGPGTLRVKRAGCGEPAVAIGVAPSTVPLPQSNSMAVPEAATVIAMCGPPHGPGFTASRRPGSVPRTAVPQLAANTATRSAAVA